MERAHIIVSIFGENYKLVIGPIALPLNRLHWTSTIC